MSRATRTGLAIAAIGLLLAGSAQAGFEEAMGLMKSGKYAEAAREFQALIETSGEWPDGHFQLGTCYLQMRQYDKAVSEFETAIGLNPDRFDYHARLALTYFTKKDYQQTINVLNKAERLATGDSQVAYLSKYRGLAYAYTGNAPAAVANLKKALPERNPVVASTLGKACYQTGEYPCAIENLGIAVQSDAQNFDLVYYLARSYLISGLKATSESQKRQHYANAVTWAEKAYNLKKASVEAEETLAKADLGAGRLAEAERLFLDLIRREPNECTHYIDLLTTLREEQKWDTMIEMAGKVTGAGGPRCEQKEQATAWTQAGFAWLKKDSDRLADATRTEYLGNSISASQKALDMGGGSFARTNLSTARENLQRHRDNIASKDRAAAEERQQCIECLKVFDFQQKTVAFLRETKQPDGDADGIADAADQCPDTPPWTLVNNQGCTDSTKKACNDLLRNSWCQELHEKGAQ